MPRQRTPVGKAALTGALQHDPQRFRDRNAPPKAGPIGAAPAWMDADTKKAWKELSADLPWLTSHHRHALTALSQLQVQMKSAEPKTASFYNAYRLMLAECGGTPASESKIQYPEAGEDDPFGFLDGPTQ